MSPSNEIKRKQIQDEIALLMGDGGEESKRNARSLLLSMERAMEPIHERIDKVSEDGKISLEREVGKVDGRLVEVERKIGTATWVLGGVGTIIAAILTAILVTIATHETERMWGNVRPMQRLNCTHLLMEGLANIPVDDMPDIAYLDRDGDGVACER